MVCLLALASSAHAALVTLQNHSFEDGPLPNEPTASTTYNSSVPDGWTGLGGPIGAQWEVTPPDGIDGDIYIYLQGGSTVVSGIAQAFTFNFSAGDVFTLTMAGRTASGSANQFVFDIRSTDTIGDAGAGDSLIGGPQTSSEMNSAFADYDVSGVATEGGTNAYLVIYREEGQSGQMRWDNVRLDVSAASVPEPSSAALVGLSGLMLVMRRRR